MSTLMSTACRDVTCAVGATLITLMLSMTFVDATEVAPGRHIHTAQVFTLEPLHGWIGEPEPAVLVD
jgi:hypothetical protein